ncbi:hypothetical protein [Halodesulfovibrio aestuarii]|uniref:Uncharacterized protein n=1 Tax=Halodesulfovibrio aestuarii TaxID=126333 RepID=A0ABV4JMZ5_9BACT
MASVMLGSAAVAATATTTGAAATTGLIGTAGAFSAMQALGTLGLLAGLGGTAASMASQNDMANSQAEYVEKVGAYNAASTKDQYRKLMSSQKASYGASGVQLDDGGTPSDVLAETMVDMEMDALSTYYGGQAKGTAFKNQARANNTASMFQGLAQAGSGAYSLLR